MAALSVELMSSVLSGLRRWCGVCARGANRADSAFRESAENLVDVLRAFPPIHRLTPDLLDQVCANHLGITNTANFQFGGQYLIDRRAHLLWRDSSRFGARSLEHDAQSPARLESIERRARSSYSETKLKRSSDTGQVLWAEYPSALEPATSF